MSESWPLRAKICALRRSSTAPLKPRAFACPCVQRHRRRRNPLPMAKIAKTGDRKKVMDTTKSTDCPKCSKPTRIVKRVKDRERGVPAESISRVPHATSTKSFKRCLSSDQRKSPASTGLFHIRQGADTMRNYVGIGVAIGARAREPAIGAALHYVGVGIAIGSALGAAFGAAMTRRKRNSN